MARYLAIWFPRLPTDRLHRLGAGAAGRPLVVAGRSGRGMAVLAADRPAAALGIGPGLALADARARVPDLVVEPPRPAADARLIAALGESCERYTPVVADDPPFGLVLEVEGSLALFGGEAGLVADLGAMLARAGVEALTGLADTPRAARALARFGGGGRVPPGGQARHLAGLPVAALELGPDVTTALRRTGLETIGDLAARPLRPLVARFGAEIASRLAALTGTADTPPTPRRPPPDLVAETRFFDPISAGDDIAAALWGLARRLCADLGEKGLGGRRFEALFCRSDGAIRRIAVATARPLAEPGRLVALFGTRLGALSDPLEAGFGFDLIRLAAPRTERLAPLQTRFDGRESEAADLADLIGRLSARFGAAAVERILPAGSHIPERALRRVPALAAGTAEAARDLSLAAALPAAGEAPLRPLLMLERPQPVETLAGVPDGPPLRFRWRRVLHEIVRVDGPERIAPEWWRAGPRARIRDYYQAEDREGRRFWLFRHGLYGEDGGEVRWYVHGLFA